MVQRRSHLLEVQPKTTPIDRCLTVSPEAADLRAVFIGGLMLDTIVDMGELGSRAKVGQRGNGAGADRGLGLRRLRSRC